MSQLDPEVYAELWDHPSENQSFIHGFAWFYFFVSSNEAHRLIERGFIREIDKPYRWGRGLRLRLSRGRALEFGVCRRRKFDHEYDAVKAALDARDTEVPPPEIGDW